MANILIITAVFPPEPVVSANLSYDIAKSLSEKHKVTVISPRPTRPFGFQFIGDKTFFEFKHVVSDSFTCAKSSILGRFRESYSFGRFCHRYISNNRREIDIIYANTWPLFGQYFVVKAARKYKIPVLVHVQDIYPESLSNKLPFGRAFFTSIVLPLDRYTLRRASKVVSISNKMKEYLLKSRKLTSNKVIVISNWQDEELFFNQLHYRPVVEGKPFCFMYLGNIGPVAGVELLLQAFSKIKFKDAKLIIAGSGSLKERLEIQAQNFPECLIEFWSVPDGQVAKLQAMADVLMLPLKAGNASTSIPSKLPAYMFSSKPIIACVDMDSDTASVINSANCGCVVEPENEESLVLMMRNFYYMEKSALALMGENGKNFALLHFSKKENLAKVVAVIESFA